MFYPSGLILLMFAGCVAIYEPYIIRHLSADLGDSNADE
jgi:hypothetical protein